VIKTYRVKSSSERGETKGWGAVWEGQVLSEKYLGSIVWDGYTDLFNRYLPSNALVLEAGCGLGKYVIYLKRNDHRVVGVDLDGQALPAYDLVDWQQYAGRNITPAILTKRGCAFSCTYCPYSKLEGKRYRLKSPQRVLAEARYILQHTNSRKVMFCENNFNVPHQHAEDICKAILAEKADFQWGTGDLRPINITDNFCRLMEASGCFYANLSIESASENMLRSMKRGYTVRQVRDSLSALSKSKIPFGASLMFGAPGETPESIA
jgi:radical SAM superfamily enzyme YgiQ (UPF0313 family)